MDLKRVIKGTKEYEECYLKAQDWWSFWKFTVPNLEFLPTNLVCAYNEAGPVCMAFLYCTDSKIAWLEFIVADPKASKSDRALAQEMVISSVKILASALNFSAVFTSSKNQHLNKKLGSKFDKAGDGISHFIRRI